MHQTTEAGRARCTGDDGAVVVESAILLPVLLALLAGILDLGVGYRDRIQIEGALRAAARMGASSQNKFNADQLILTSLAGSMAGIKNAQVQMIIVYETDTTGAVSATCLGKTPSLPTTPQTGVGDPTTDHACNVYSEQPMKQAGNTSSATWFTASGATTCNTSTIDRFFCPVTRKVLLTDTGSGGSGPDYLGVYMKVTYTPYTKFWGASFTLTDQVVVRLEPAAA